VDDRLERAVDWLTLERVRRFSRVVHALPGWKPDGLATLFRHQVRVDAVELPADLFGFVICENHGDRERERWSITINGYLPLAAANATLGHEFGHCFQREGLAAANCAPRAGLPIVEQEAHAIGALLTVPLAAVRGLRFGDGDERCAIAAALAIPASYVEIRAALAVFLGEMPGQEYQASAHLNWGMLAHQRWMSRIADYLAAQDGAIV
jgi:hypothetical protein